MLVLSRFPNEEIMIGDDIRIMVIGVLGDKVRIGIDAPKDVPVHRSEVYNAIQRDQAAAVAVAKRAAEAQERPPEPVTS